jgi:predicted dienelactone hydrolase
MLTIFLLLFPVQDSATYADPGPQAVTSITFDWKDKVRSDREVPVRLYYSKESKGPCPVILWSHGLGGNRDAYGYLGNFWASHGYIVVHSQHRGSDSAVLREGGMQALRTAGNARNAIDRPKDITFILDQLTELNEKDGPLQGKLDLNQVGIGGHSFGAQTTLLTGGQLLGPAMAYVGPRARRRIA